MFQRLRIWLSGNGGLKEATREAARQATREGLVEGFHQGVQDFLEELTGGRAVDAKPIEVTTSSNGNGHHEPHPLTASELRGMRKADLLELAEARGVDADESWTVSQLREELVS